MTARERPIVRDPHARWLRFFWWLLGALYAGTACYVVRRVLE